MTCNRKVLCPLSVVIIIVALLQALGTTFLPSSETASYDLILTVQTERPYYGLGELVKICGNLTDTNGTAVQDAKIAIEVKNPRNNTIFLDMVFSSVNGTYEDSLRLDKNTALGEYHVYATANAAGYPTAMKQTTFTVLTMASLSETSSSESTLNETLLVHQTIMNGVTVSGNLTGTLNFTNFEIVNITTGAFAGKGFSKGEWKATLEGISYTGNWEGMLFLKPSERKIYLKGAISGEISSTVEGYISETINGSGIYDRYQTTWKVGRLRTTIVSATLNVNGTIFYQSSSEFPATELYVLQTSIEGSAIGHYNCSLSSTLTHVRILGNTSHSGEGFSIISYVSNYGMGEGWTYDRLASLGIVEMRGFLTNPLYGVVYATLNETAIPRSLRMYIGRVDLGLPPMADLKLSIWGPERVSPGQKIAYAIEIRNDGLKSANNVTIVNEFPWAVDYLSNTGNGIYTAYFREVSWRLDVPAKGKVDLATQGRVIWGLADGTLVASFVDAPEIRYVETDPTLGTEFEIVQSNATYSKVKAIIHNQTESSITFWETSIVKVPEMREPTVEVKDLPDDKREILYKFFIFDPSPGMYDELTIKMVENIGAVDKLLGFANRLPGYVDKTGEFELDQDWANNLYQNGKIDEETWRKLQYIGTGEYLLQTIGKELATFSPISGKSVSSMTWDEPIARFVQHYRMTTIALYDLDLYFDLYDGVHKSRITVARDPNVKYGYDGYVSQGQTLNYTVEYENEGEGIAFGVYITETLDEDLNDSTLEIDPVINKANGSVIAGPGTYNPAIRTITWLVGEVGSDEGGFVNFTIKVKNDAPEGTEVINSATVYFPSVPEMTRTNTIISVVGHPSIVITDLTPLDTVIAKGSILYLNLTVANEGYLAETFNVTIYANSTIIRTESITMPGRSENSILFLWNTTNFTIGNYNISAYAWPVPGETNTTDNLYVYGIVQIVPPIHDIAITNITFSKQNPAINETIQIFVTIENRGTLTETFDVSANYTLLLDPLIGVQTITLAPGQSITLNFTWTPNATGRYEIKAYTGTIVDDINPDDNIKTCYLYVTSGGTSGSVGGRIPYLY